MNPRIAVPLYSVLAFAASMALAGSAPRPSAENESGVRLSTPMTKVRSPSTSGARPGSGMVYRAREAESISERREEMKPRRSAFVFFRFLRSFVVS